MTCILCGGIKFHDDGTHECINCGYGSRPKEGHSVMKPRHIKPIPFKYPEFPGKRTRL